MYKEIYNAALTNNKPLSTNLNMAGNAWVVGDFKYLQQTLRHTYGHIKMHKLQLRSTRKHTTLWSGSELFQEPLVKIPSSQWLHSEYRHMLSS
jgi:hypothetical protein